MPRLFTRMPAKRDHDVARQPLMRKGGSKCGNRDLKGNVSEAVRQACETNRRDLLKVLRKFLQCGWIVEKRFQPCLVRIRQLSHIGAVPEVVVEYIVPRRDDCCVGGDIYLTSHDDVVRWHIIA